MTDAINRGDDSDRILVHWSLASPEVAQACAGSPVRATVPPGAAASWVQVPRDIEALRLTDPEQARVWRIKVRDQLTTALDAGGRVAGFDKAAGLPRPAARRRSAMSVKLEGVELRRIAMPLVSPFRTSFGTQTARDILLLRAVTADGEGWGECVAMSDPLYSSEYVDATADVLRRFFLPTLAASSEELLRHGAHAVGAVLAPVQGPPDGEGRAGDGRARRRAAGRRAVARRASSGRSTTRVPCGVSVGIFDSIPQLLDAVGGYLDEGYVRIKLKIEPGWDVEPVRAVRERFGDDVLLQVDANTAYTLRDARHLAKLDAFDLLLIEQPLEEEDVLGHAELARLITTPVCLDESIVSAQSAAAAISARCLLDHQHQAGPGRRLPRGRAHPRRGRRPRAGRVVRRHGRDRARAGGQRGTRRAARLHAPR